MSELSQAERTAMHDAYVQTEGSAPEICEQMWLAARDYGREREEKLRLAEHRASVRHQEERIRREKVEERERTLEGALRRLLVSAVPTRTDAERDAALENALDLLAASQPEVLSERSDTGSGRKPLYEGRVHFRMPSAEDTFPFPHASQPDHGPGEPSERPTWNLFCPECEQTSVDMGDGSCETCGAQTISVVQVGESNG